MTGEHRAPRRWAPARVAGVAGFVLVADAAPFAAAGWLGWWRGGLGIAFVHLVFAVVLIAWAHGYATCAEQGP
jgi:hypothetical protein